MSARRERLYEVIFEADTPLGKLFDLGLLVAILASVTVVMLESVAEFASRHGPLLRGLEWGFTALFTVEYCLRLWSVRQPLRYARSFFGIVDLLAIVPTYLSLLVAGTQSLAVIRIMRLVRVFRVLKLAQLLGEARHLRRALRASVPKITVFTVVVLCLVVIVGASMHLIEGEDSGFTSIPAGMYWAVVTVTTVGYGDIAPQTTVGQVLAAMLMIAGYGIIAVPTGIVAAEIAHQPRDEVTTQVCPSCLREGHDVDAVYCRVCGAKL